MKFKKTIIDISMFLASVFIFMFINKYINSTKLISFLATIFIIDISILSI